MTIFITFNKAIVCIMQIYCLRTVNILFSHRKQDDRRNGLDGLNGHNGHDGRLVIIIEGYQIKRNVGMAPSPWERVGERLSFPWERVGERPYFLFVNCSTTRAMAPSPVTLQAVPKESMAI